MVRTWKERGRRRHHVAGPFGRIRGICLRVGEPPGEAVQGEIKGRDSFLVCVLKACSMVQLFTDSPAALQVTQHGFG